MIKAGLSLPTQNSKTVVCEPAAPVVNQKKTLTENIADFLAAEGSDNFGFVPAQRMEELSENQEI